MSHAFRFTGALALLAALGGCDSTGPEATGGTVRMSVATRPGGTLAPAGMAQSGAPVTYTDGTNTLIIEKVEMVVKEVELEREESTEACDAADSTAQGSFDSDDDACEELETGPFLLDLPLAGGATSVVTVEVLPGTYDEFEFEVHKPEDDDSNAAFLAAHPDFEDVSIRVTGTWNGVPYTYETDLDAEQEMDLVPPLVVTETGSADFTLFIDIGTWFRAGDGSLLDPSTANQGGANEELVEENIQNSFEAFEDHDRDGHDDHGED